jgi:hypothetical protein
MKRASSSWRLTEGPLGEWGALDCGSLLPPPALGEGGHCVLAGRRIPMRRRAVFVMAEGPRPHPWRTNARRMDLQRCVRQQCRRRARRSRHRVHSLDGRLAEARLRTSVATREPGDHLRTHARMALTGLSCCSGRKVALLSASKMNVPPGLIAIVSRMRSLSSHATIQGWRHSPSTKRMEVLSPAGPAGPGGPSGPGGP